MIITKPESTLFGGWAKAHTPLKIEFGVSKISDIASVSISKAVQKIRFRLYKNDPKRPKVQVERLEVDDNGKNYYVRLPSSEIEAKAMSNVRDLLIDNFKHAALVRYTEIWAESLGIESRIFIRGVQGTEKLKQSFGGMLGVQNGKGLIKKEGKWQVKDIEKLYPEIKRLPYEGIARAKELVCERGNANNKNVG